MDRPKILVVDDDAEMQNVLPVFLKRILDCDVVVKSNGSEAIQALDQEAFHIIVQDLQMPGIDGFTVLAHAIQRYPEIVRIVLTGLLDPAVTKRVEDLGAVFIAKPFQPKVLQLVVDQAFKTSPALKQFAH